MVLYIDSLGGEEVQVGFVDCNRISIFEGIHTSNWAQPLYHTKALTSCHLNLTNSIFLHSSCFCGTLFNSIIFNELKAQSIRCLVQVFWKIIFGKKHLNILHSLILIKLFWAPSKPSKGQVGELEIILKAITTSNLSPKYKLVKYFVRTSTFLVNI